MGRVGRVGQAALEKQLALQTPIKELFLHGEQEIAAPQEQLDTVEELEDSQAMEVPLTPAALDAALRLEAYNWPRLIFPPLKKPGHVILDGCTPEGKSFALLTDPTNSVDRKNHAHDGSEIARQATIL